MLVGFARNAVLGVADKVIAGVKSGAIRHFFLVGGCDGAKPGRNYYTRLVELVPKDCVVLTLACGKFRFFDKQLGDIDGIPRLLDVGQCNDAYSAIQIALALAKAFNCDVNELPLSMILSCDCACRSHTYKSECVSFGCGRVFFHLGNTGCQGQNKGYGYCSCSCSRRIKGYRNKFGRRKKREQKYYAVRKSKNDFLRNIKYSSQNTENHKGCNTDRNNYYEP